MAKYRRERLPTAFTTTSMTTSTPMVTNVSSGLITSIISSVPEKFRAQEIRLAKLLFKASDTVSISLVYRLISSP